MSEKQLGEILETVSDIESSVASLQSDVSSVESDIDDLYELSKAHFEEIDKALVWIANKLNDKKPDPPKLADVIPITGGKP